MTMMFWLLTMPGDARDPHLWHLCYVDQDRDGWGAEVSGDDRVGPCGRGRTRIPGDCHDHDASIHPGASEVPGDGVDQDCDRLEDCFEDLDGDRYGSATTTPSIDLACDDPFLSASSSDCDDLDPEVHPGAFDLPADGVDQDCDGGDRCFQDADGDGYGNGLVLVDSPDLVCGNEFQEAWQTGDCDDTDAGIWPGAPEIPVDGVDQDCDAGDLCYLDGDGDGFGDGQTIPGEDLDCTNGANECDQLGDCGPDDPLTHPGGSEICGDGADNDCDGSGGPDTDDDGDGLPYEIETAIGGHDCSVDTDGDGVRDGLEILLGDSDGDGTWNIADGDDDGDGIPTAVEGTGDGEADLGCPNADAIPNYLDLDSDGDGVEDRIEGLHDEDLDGEPDYLDCVNQHCTRDTDADGVADCYELALGTSVFSQDSDGDMVPDGLELGSYPVAPRPPDTDGDGIIDALDVDDDGDTVPTVTEDLDGNGDPTDDDTDGNGVPNYHDPDDDGDGIDTADEDADGNGSPTNDDVDGDGVPDFADPDDTDGHLADADGDGLSNGFEALLGSNSYDDDTDADGRTDDLELGIRDDPRDTDSDGLPDLRDPEDDGDGIPSVQEGWTDVDGDGVPNALDDDSDDDGILDSREGMQDTDCDGLPASQDADETDGPCGDTGALQPRVRPTRDPDCGCATGGPIGVGWWLVLGALVRRGWYSRPPSAP